MCVLFVTLARREKSICVSPFLQLSTFIISVEFPLITQKQADSQFV